ncbi:MAG: hypothetical protein JXR10_11105 [Cyclobacteriaceae bacterium]
MNLRDYLKQKKIDPDQLKNSEPELYRGFAIEFSQMHPDSFTSRKLFLINKLRRKYKFTASEEAEKPKTINKVKPKIVPRIK